MELRIENLSKMTPGQEKRFFDQFEHELDSDSGEAAKSHLDAGRPIFYEDPKYPEQIVKEYPEGQRQIVDFDMATGKEILIREL